MNKLLLIAVLLAGCPSPVDNVAAGYEIELDTCVEVSDTREEYEQCKQRVMKRYDKEWENAVD